MAERNFCGPQPLAVTLHLRDSVIYETRGGVAVPWVPLGEGVIDFCRIVATARELCPMFTSTSNPSPAARPSSGRFGTRDSGRSFPDSQAASLARFLALARNGHPYEREMVIEDIAGRPPIEAYNAAPQYQQRDHMEKSVEYAKKTLDLGVKWRA